MKTPVQLAFAAFLTLPVIVAAEDTPVHSCAQIESFLLTAHTSSFRNISTGTTGTHRLTLEEGNFHHDAHLQTIDESKTSFQSMNGNVEMNFRDSYKYNIAAFELAEMLGLGDMMPVTVERKWEGRRGSLSWWLPAKMDEGQRRDKHIEPPDRESWNKQVNKMNVFGQLVYDTDRYNPGNALISADWHLWMIDFSRAFRLYLTLEDPKKLTMCDRQLFQKLRQLDAEELKRRTKSLLNAAEVKGVMARRDKIVAFFEDLIAKQGEAAVLYD